MFLELNDFKGLIIDLDSFIEKDDTFWPSISKKVKLLFYSANPDRLSSMQTKIPSCKIYRNIHSEKQINEFLYELCKEISLESYEVVFVSKDMKALNIFRTFPVSTIGVKVKRHLNYTECSNLPYMNQYNIYNKIGIKTDQLDPF